MTEMSQWPKCFSKKTACRCILCRKGILQYILWYIYMYIQ